MNCEAWIWTELLAFDNAAADLGVGEYLTALASCPRASRCWPPSDFIVLHDGIERVRAVARCVCPLRAGGER